MSWLALLALGFAIGLVLGTLFFGGLWWTSTRLAVSANAASLIALSFVGRLAVLAGALIVVARIDDMVLIGSLPGLIAARMALTRAAASNRPPVPSSIPGERGRASDGRA